VAYFWGGQAIVFSHRNDHLYSPDAAQRNEIVIVKQD